MPPRFYRQALARDPNFVEAAADLVISRLSRTLARLAFGASGTTGGEVAHRPRSNAISEFAGKAHLALGLFFSFGHRQYEMALAEFNRTLELQPNNALAQRQCASVYPPSR